MDAVRDFISEYADWFTFLGFVIGVISLFLGIYTLFTANNIKKIQLSAYLQKKSKISEDIQKLENIAEQTVWGLYYLDDICAIVNVYLPIVSCAEKRILKQQRKRLQSCKGDSIKQRNVGHKAISETVAILKRYEAIAERNSDL